MFGGMPAEKSKDFRTSFRRLLLRLRPERPLIVLVFILAIVSVTFAILGPKILGNATNLLFEGVVSKQLPAGFSQEQVVAQLRASGDDQKADRIVVMDAGRIVGSGTHTELLESNETYREIVYSQLSEAEAVA